MPLTAPSRHISVRIERSFEAAYAALSDPMTWPDWASGMGQGLQPLPDGDYAIRSVDGSQARVRFTPANVYGVLDHIVFAPGADPIPVPMRLIRNGQGCELTFTLLRTPAMTGEAFAADAAWVERDLTRLKQVLEA